MRAAWQGPLDAYPAWTGDSVAAQKGSPVKPVTVNVAGEASLAFVGLGSATVPLAQLRVTLTVVVSVPGLSEKSLLTEKIALLGVGIGVGEGAGNRVGVGGKVGGGVGVGEGGKVGGGVGVGVGVGVDVGVGV